MSGLHNDMWQYGAALGAMMRFAGLATVAIASVGASIWKQLTPVGSLFNRLTVH